MMPELRDDPRMAGCVERYHTWPHLRKQTNAEHSWQVARLVLAIWPECRRELLVHALVHDIGEIGTGDIPFPVKRDNPEVKKATDMVERRAHLTMCIPWSLPAPPNTTNLERKVLKIADMMDMWEWSLQEQAMGNQFANIVRQRTGGWLCSLLKTTDLTLAESEIPAWAEILRRMSEYMQRRIAIWHSAGPQLEEFA